MDRSNLTHMVFSEYAYSAACVLTRESTKTIVGWVIVCGHLIILAALILQRDLSSDQKTKILLTLSPIATTYLVSVVKSFISNSAPVVNLTPVNMNYVLITIILPVVLLLFIFYFIAAYPTSLADSSDALQKWVASVEVALGGTVGLVVDDLFPRART